MKREIRELVEAGQKKMKAHQEKIEIRMEAHLENTEANQEESRGPEVTTILCFDLLCCHCVPAASIVSSPISVHLSSAQLSPAQPSPAQQGCKHVQGLYTF